MIDLKTYCPKHGFTNNLPPGEMHFVAFKKEHCPLCKNERDEQEINKLVKMLKETLDKGIIDEDKR